MSLTVPEGLSEVPSVRAVIGIPMTTSEGVTTARMFSFSGLADDGDTWPSVSVTLDNRSVRPSSGCIRNV